MTCNCWDGGTLGRLDVGMLGRWAMGRWDWHPNYVHTASRIPCIAGALAPAVGSGPASNDADVHAMPHARRTPSGAPIPPAATPTDGL